MKFRENTIPHLDSYFFIRNYEIRFPPKKEIPCSNNYSSKNNKQKKKCYMNSENSMVCSDENNIRNIKT